MPLDVPPKKDVKKEGDKPVEHAAENQQARVILGLEATKKPEAKAPAAPVEGGLADYLAQGIDKASTLFSDAASLLPTLTIDDKKSTGGKLDIDGYLKNNCNKEDKSEVCKTGTVDSGIAGFSFKADSPLITDKKTDSVLTEAERKLSASDWKQLYAIYDSQNPNKAGQIESTANAQVHRDAAGKVDVLKTADGVVARTNDGGSINSNDAGEKVKIGPDGKLQAGFDKDQNFVAVLDSGRRMVIAKGSDTVTFVGTDGVPFGQAFNRVGEGFKVIGEYKNGSLITTDNEVHSQDGLSKAIEEGARRAAITGKTVVIQADGGVVAVAPDKSFAALQNDGSSIVSMPDGRFVVRDGKGNLSIVDKNGNKEEVSKEFLASVRENMQPEMRALREAAKKLVAFSNTNTLIATDGTTRLSINGDTTTAVIEGSVHSDRTENTTTNTNLVDNSKQTVDSKTGIIVNTSPSGVKDTVEVKPNGKIRIQTKNYTYDSGTVTTKEGDVFTADHVKLANGTEIDKNNNVNFADGSVMRADGSYSSSSGSRVEKLVAAKAAESKAASMAGYAESMAGAIRSRAASGHATASDIASLESVFAGLCDAVTALGMVGDPSVAFKLYSAKGAVSESISTGLANLNNNNGIKAA